jgi:predicted nucleic acid binding AN1-type Zn finger protein
MELTIKGEAHCAECGQSDFLPLPCPHCLKQFCAKHRELGSHSGCSGSGSAAATASAPVPRAFEFSCFLCSKPLPVELTCPLCRNVCCHEHRDPSAHKCSMETGKATSDASGARGVPSSAAPKPANSSLSALKAVAAPLGAPEDPEKKAKNDALRRKVALTKIKVKCGPAKGIAVEDQLFLESESVSDAVASAGAGGSSASFSAPQYHCVSSRTTSVAQLLDAIAAAHKIANRNSAETDPTKRLHLYVKEPSAGAAKDWFASVVPVGAESREGAEAELCCSSSSPLSCRLLPDASLRTLVAAGLVSNGDTLLLLRGLFITRQ